jgi:hypothetical protein
MPDTFENQQAYPQPYNQKPGLGFPIARVGGIVSLSCGAILNLGFCRYAGKGQGEVSLIRRLWDVLQAGDILLTDCQGAGWAGIMLLKLRGVDSVSRLNHIRRMADFRKGTRLGKDDHIVQWKRPNFSRTIEWKTWQSLPESLTVREARFRVDQPGFRSRSIVIVTTLLDPVQTTKEDLAELYRARWNNELDLRSIKCTMQMDILRCKTTELVRKEVWTHMLAYNLIRTVMTQAASKHDIQPRSISFKGTLQTLEAFRPLIDFQSYRGQAFRLNLYQELLDAVVQHRVADRPNRFEPRYKKRRSKRFVELKMPRHEFKRAVLKGLLKN